jgi:hypothetical protein
MLGSTLEKMARRSSWKIWSEVHQVAENLKSFSTIGDSLMEDRAIEDVSRPVSCSLSLLPLCHKYLRQGGKLLFVNPRNRDAYKINRRTAVAT